MVGPGFHTRIQSRALRYLTARALTAAPGTRANAPLSSLDVVTEALTRDWDKHRTSVYARGAFCAVVRVRCLFHFLFVQFGNLFGADSWSLCVPSKVTAWNAHIHTKYR